MASFNVYGSSGGSRICQMGTAGPKLERQKIGLGAGRCVPSGHPPQIRQWDVFTRQS